MRERDHSEEHEEIFGFNCIPSRHAMLPPKFHNGHVVPNFTFSHRREANQRGPFFSSQRSDESAGGASRTSSQSGSEHTLSRTSAYAY